jgi:hypothetical protein
MKTTINLSNSGMKMKFIKYMKCVGALVSQNNITKYSYNTYLVTKSLQNNTKMLLMLFFILGVDQDVVNEDHDKLIQLRHEDEVHQVHEMCRSIGESKQHNQILIQHIPGGEGSLRGIFQTDLDLMVTRTEIDL